ncbi:MAG: (d)CMP kinase [Tenuifilum sp.]|uniref:(d)CMP kinase n=1 Tax=Tenuifilum sp. TaxID=2760880 RepID=UPI002B5DCF04|nr:(d)CMP kinase [Tenuifilum sp.]HOK86765.1 (d)CMP kinase [Tenuifilum sp.]HON70050.1 (d)CMP kinase [Tenuifilum sp.]HOU75412.1 (d)CMP kinase [Tenuifilum sp.]HPP91107.1 (d)CMP kinase [Tenuifilum sp.]
MDKKIVIAIDGFSSCGKSTFAKAIAKRLGYLYIDSGAMYRVVTLELLRRGLINDGVVDTSMLQSILKEINIGFSYDPVKMAYLTTLNGEVVEDEIRSPQVANHVSLVAAIPAVRTRLVELQRELGKKKGIVMDGRDIGTVVFPDAELKIFMTADPIVRARRRLKELQEKGLNVTLDEVLKNIEERDYIDQNRDVAPLRKADDAVVLDNTNMTVEEQMEWVEEMVKRLTV